MTPIQWQETSSNTPASSSQATGNPPVVSSNPWFAVAMGLIGLIVGFAMSRILPLLLQ